MGYNRSGTRRKQRLKRARRENDRLARKADQQSSKPETAAKARS